MITILSVYAQTFQTNEKTIMSFCKTLRAAIPEDAKLIIINDFSARVGRNDDIHSRYGIGNRNDSKSF